MKKLLFLLIVLSLILCSCTPPSYRSDVNDSPNDVLGEDGKEIDEKTEDGTKDGTEVLEQVDPFEDASYEDIERRKTTSYQSKCFGFKEDGKLLQLKYPYLWSLREVDKGYEITRANEPIGYIAGGVAGDTDDWKVLNSESSNENDIHVTKYIERKKGDKIFRYRYVYRYTVGEFNNTVTLTVSYEELDTNSEKTLCNEVACVDKYPNSVRGVLSFSDEPSSILILGNSFIATSDIGDILREMLQCNGKVCNVEAISRGYAKVGTYTSDGEVLGRINKGIYDMVFICGLYGLSEIENLGKLKTVCDRSNTQLVIFPAHNETAGAVTYVQEKDPSFLCVNWQRELNLLINNGVSRWDLCINDSACHSAPLAGYVGAHMIYRAIYDELPSQPMRYVLNQSNINRTLGNYAYIGDICAFTDDEMMYLD